MRPCFLFHVSESNHHGEVFYPRIPRRPVRDEHFEIELEDATIPRVCFSTTLDGALKGAQPSQLVNIYVHMPDHYGGEIWWNDTVQRYVADACYTNEVWLMEPVRLRIVGKVMIHKEWAKKVTLPPVYRQANPNIPPNTAFWICKRLEYSVTGVYDPAFVDYLKRFDRNHYNEIKTGLLGEAKSFGPDDFCWENGGSKSHRVSYRVSCDEVYALA